MGRIRLLALALTFAWPAGDAMAEASLRISTRINADAGPGAVLSGPDRVHQSLGQSDGSLSAKGTAEAKHGFLAFSGKTQAFTEQAVQSNAVEAVIEASFADSVTFLGAPAGTVLRVGYSLYTESSISALCLGEASPRTFCASSGYEASLTFAGTNTTFSFHASQATDGFSVVTGSVDGDEGFYPLGSFEREALVEAGAPIALRASVRVQVNAGAEDVLAGFSAVSLGTLYWAGITSVTSLDGAPVDYTLTSLSGTDYRQSVSAIPEPSAWLLLLIGLAVVGATSRRRTASLRVPCPIQDRRPPHEQPDHRAAGR